METTQIICPFCQSKEIIKRGLIKTENREFTQRYGCKTCNNRFVLDSPFYKMKNKEEVITMCMDLYYSGMSFRKIADHLKRFFPKNVNASTIYRWVLKFVPMMEKFTDKQKLNNSVSLQGDEVEYHRRKYRNRKGVDRNWFVDVIDTKSRYVISSDYLTNRELNSMKKVWGKAKKKTGNSVKYISTDGLHIYTRVLQHTFKMKTRHRKSTKTSPVFHQVIKSQSGKFNYKVERFHNTLRERTKIMRGFHGCITSAQTLMKGYEIYYNWIREHQSLKGLTPQQLAIPNIQIENKNGWLELIQRGYDGR